MDPDETLRLISEALQDGDEEEAWYLAKELRNWISRGGFEPNWKKYPKASGLVFPAWRKRKTASNPLARMSGLPSNIDKSGFHRGQFVGYADGAWKISGGPGSWRAYHQNGKYLPVTGRTLQEISTRITHEAGSKKGSNPMRRRRRRRNGGAWKGVHRRWGPVVRYRRRKGPVRGHKRRVNPRGGSYSAFVKKHKGLFKRMTFRQATKRIGMMWRKSH